MGQTVSAPVRLASGRSSDPSTDSSDAHSTPQQTLDADASMSDCNSSTPGTPANTVNDESTENSSIHDIPLYAAQSLNNSRRRRRPSSAGSDELGQTSNTRQCRRQRSSFQRLRDTVMSRSLFSSAATPASNASPSSSTAFLHESNELNDQTDPNLYRIGTDNTVSNASIGNQQPEQDKHEDNRDDTSNSVVPNSHPGTSSSEGPMQSVDSETRQSIQAVQESLARRRGQLYNRAPTFPSFPRPNRLVSLLSGHSRENNDGTFQTPSPGATEGAGSRGSGSDGDLETQAAMLSRLLVVAATVTANSLVGNAGRQGRGLSFEGFRQGGRSDDGDATFGGFLERLQNGLLTSELSNSLEEQEVGQARNFFRMFRFPPAQSSEDTPSENLIPVLIVGVRAVDAMEEGQQHDHAAAHMNAGGVGLFDAVSARPIRMNNANNNTGSGVENDANDDFSENTWNWTSTDGNNENTASHETSHRENAEIRSDNILDGIYSGLARNLAGDRRPTLSSASSLSSLSSGNGHEEHTNADAPRREHRQSWIVYVVGGTYPDNHPILLAPSLFTDHPSYEDLLILENFLGQAKPPVATEEEVNKSGGLLTIGKDMEKPKNERCLVCLSEYQDGDECRKLGECDHMFHRECIDQWLTTGRNSCPLCRSQGVASSHKTAETTGAAE